MKPHTKIYLDAIGKKPGEHIPCEICWALDPNGEGAPAVDIHHIERRGMGGDKSADTPENLMAMCRQHHTELGDIIVLKPHLKQIHLKYLNHNKS